MPRGIVFFFSFTSSIASVFLRTVPKRSARKPSRTHATTVTIDNSLLLSLSSSLRSVQAEARETLSPRVLAARPPACRCVIGREQSDDAVESTVEETHVMCRRNVISHCRYYHHYSGRRRYRAAAAAAGSATISDLRRNLEKPDADNTHSRVPDTAARNKIRPLREMTASPRVLLPRSSRLTRARRRVPPIRIRRAPSGV